MMTKFFQQQLKYAVFSGTFGGIREGRSFEIRWEDFTNKSFLSTLSTLIFTQFLQSFLNAARAGTQLGSGPERHVFSLNTTDRTDDRSGG